MKWFHVLIAFMIFFVIILLVCFFPTAETQISGIDNYSPSNSTLGLSANLFPSEDFLDQFPYTTGDYRFFFNGRMYQGYSTALVVLRYTPEQYRYAKEYCLEQFTLTDEHQFQIGSYTFVEHLCYTSKDEDGEYFPACQYPRIFNMYAYNDSNNTLLFLGYYNGNPDASPTQLALTDFESFYNEHFSQYYVLEQ